MLTVSIKGMEWTVCAEYEKEFKEELKKSNLNPELSENYGLCDKMNHRIWLKLPVSIFTIRHEVYHAYVGSCHVTTCENLDAGDMEEIGAELISYHLEDIHNTSLYIYKELEKAQARGKNGKNKKKAK